MGETALTWAAYFGRQEIVKVLVHAGAYVNLQTMVTKMQLVTDWRCIHILFLLLLVHFPWSFFADWIHGPHICSYAWSPGDGEGTGAGKC